jgi:hypothetical protein
MGVPGEARERGRKKITIAKGSILPKFDKKK